jgi:hypothetical protein
MHKKLVFILILCAAVQAVFSQKIILSVLAPAGDYKSLSGYSLSWTMGEVMTETFASGDLKLTQGFQQPRLSVSSGLQDEHLNWTINAYPNPVSHKLSISFQGLQGNPVVHIALLDIMGRMVIMNELKNLPEFYHYSLDLENLDRGIYILRVYTLDYQMQKLFKIEKQ